MAKTEILMIVALAALVCANEVEDVEQKKRGAGKTASLNSIPTGAQKPEYSYNVYTQTANTQSNSPSTSYQTSPSYQAHVPNSFYPSQNSQYYTSNSDSNSYQQQPQINVIPSSTQSQFVPLNFIPNPGYQAKYQLVPSKNSQGSLQLALVQQPSSFPSPSLLHYPQSLLSHNPNQIHQQQNPFGPISPQGYFNVAPNFQPIIGNPNIGQPSMVLVSQPNPSLYNNLLYPNPVQSFYNYYPSNSQAKYSLTYGSQSAEYDKLQGSIGQSIPKEDSDVANSDYGSGDSSYKNAYATSRGSSYTKL